MATGEIFTEIDNLEFQAGGPADFIINPDWLKVPDIDYVVVVYTHTDSDGEIATISLDGDGNIGAAVTDTAWFDTDRAQASRLLNLGGTAFFAVVYQGPNQDGWLKTFSVASDGTISSIIASLEFETTNCYLGGVIHLSGTKYAFVYLYGSGGNDYGRVITVNIDDDGAGLSVVDGPDNFITTGLSSQTVPEIIKVSGIIYAILYTDKTDDDIMVKTISIADDGTIGAVADTKTITTLGSGVNHAQIVKLSNNKYVVAYKDSPGATQGVSFSITKPGVIGAVLDTKELMVAGTNTMGIDLLQIVKQYFLVASDSDPNDGWLYSYSIDEDTGVFSSSIDSYEFDLIRAYRFRILNLSANLYGILWQGNINKGHVSSFKVMNIIALPSRALTRITGIIHNFYPKAADHRLRYSMTCVLGGISVFAGKQLPPIEELPGRVKPRPPFIWPGLQIPEEFMPSPLPKVPEEPLPGEEPKIPGRPGPERPQPGGDIPKIPKPGGPRLPGLPNLP